MLAQKIAKLADMLLETAIGHVAAVARKNFRLRQVYGRSVLVWIAEDKFPWLEWRPGAGRRHVAACLQ